MQSQILKYQRNFYVKLTVADPGFSWGGCQLIILETLSKNLSENERIGILKGLL